MDFIVLFWMCIIQRILLYTFDLFFYACLLTRRGGIWRLAGSNRFGKDNDFILAGGPCASPVADFFLPSACCFDEREFLTDDVALVLTAWFCVFDERAERCCVGERKCRSDDVALVFTAWFCILLERVEHCCVGEVEFLTNDVALVLCLRLCDCDGEETNGLLWSSSETTKWDKCIWWFFYHLIIFIEIYLPEKSSFLWMKTWHFSISWK